MKKLLVVALAAMLLSGCGGAINAEMENDDRFSGITSFEITQIITDSETGCKYLYVRSVKSGGLSPDV